MNLQQLGIKSGTDKALYHTFLPFYDRFLSEIRESAERVVEIGVLDGASLVMWRDYFPNAQIIGVDNKPHCLAREGARIEIMILDQSDPRSIDQLKHSAPFDLIVDDGSHYWSDQILTFKTLWKHVNRGGYYILEDLHTSYEPHARSREYHGEGRISGADYLKTYVDDLLRDTPYGVDELEFIAFGRRTSIMRKA